MSLLALPPETIVQILDHVGSSFFREELGRLLVCRQWFEYAVTAYSKHLRFSQKTLRRLLSCGEVTRNLLMLNNNLESLDLRLKGFEDWNSIPQLPGYLQRGTPLSSSDWEGEYGAGLLTAWTTALDNDLAQLSIAARNFRKLRIIRVQALSERHPLLPQLPRRNYLSFSTMRTLLSVENLKSLELDLCGTLLTSYQKDRNDLHICPTVGVLLNTLRRLRLRMRTICADVLRPQQYDTGLRLTEVIINLSLSNETWMITSASHSSRCGSTGGDLADLRVDIVNQAEALAGHMASPKTIRILTHTLPQLEMRSLDVLTGKSMILADDKAWEDDGETVKEDPDDSEPESDIDSLSTFSNDSH